MNTCSYLQELLYEEIPLCHALQLNVESWEGHELNIKLPLAPNMNHLSSAFGGSLYCGAVLVGWGWLHLRLRELGITNGHIVIQGGHVSYPLPVLGDSMAVCAAPSEAAWNKFQTMFTRHRKGRLILNTAIRYDGKEAVLFEGQYVVYCEN